MTNNNALVAFTANAMPDFLREAQGKSTLDDQSTTLSINRITQHNGSIVQIVDGDTSPPSLSIDVVILDASPKGRDSYRAYYDGVWKEGEASAPVCYSADGKVPHPQSKQCQALSCDQCPRNQPGTGLNGKGRACSYFKHFAVATYPELDKVFRLKVSASSLFEDTPDGVPSPLGGSAFSMKSYIAKLKQSNAGWERVVTRISLPLGQTKGFYFTPVGWLASQEQFDQVRALQNDTQAMDDVLTVGLSTNAHVPDLNETAPALPAPAVLSDRDRWLASALPAQVIEWIKVVDEETARPYIAQHYPQFL